MTAAVFVIHKDAHLRSNVSELLALKGYTVHAASSLDTAWPDVKLASPDLILLSWLNETAARADLQRLEEAPTHRLSRIIMLAQQTQMREAIAALGPGAPVYYRGATGTCECLSAAVAGHTGLCSLGCAYSH